MFKPYDLAHLTVPTSMRRRVVEIISHPTDDDCIMVRTVPGEPTTMIEVAIAGLLPHNKARYCHIARVVGIFSFPEDMLRYDGAALYNHDWPEEAEYDVDLQVRAALMSPEGVLVYTTTNRKSSPWTVDRWSSFGCTIKPILIRHLFSHTDNNATRLA